MATLAKTGGFYTIGGLLFSSKDAIKKHCQKVLARYPIGASLDRDDFKFICDLLNYHDNAEIKIGVGVARITVRLNPEFKQRCFWLYRHDGSNSDFSYNVCLNPPTKLAQFKQACRAAVTEQIFAALDKAFANKGQIRCEVTGAMITREQAHVDHIPPVTFATILDDYIVEAGIQVESIPLTPTEDGKIGARFTRQSDASNFANFHRERARLRVVSSYANTRIVPMMAKTGEKQAALFDMEKIK